MSRRNFCWISNSDLLRLLVRCGGENINTKGWIMQCSSSICKFAKSQRKEEREFDGWKQLDTFQLLFLFAMLRYFSALALAFRFCNTSTYLNDSVEGTMICGHRVCRRWDVHVLSCLSGSVHKYHPLLCILHCVLLTMRCIRFGESFVHATRRYSVPGGALNTTILSCNLYYVHSECCRGWALTKTRRRSDTTLVH